MLTQVTNATAGEIAAYTDIGPTRVDRVLTPLLRDGRLVRRGDLRGVWRYALAPPVPSVVETTATPRAA